MGASLEDGLEPIRSSALSHWTLPLEDQESQEVIKGQEPAEAEKEQRRERGGEGTSTQAAG